MTQNMFLYRLKAELPENIRLLIPYWLCLAINFLASLMWWLDNDIPNHSGDLSAMLSGFTTLGIAGFAVILVATMFKRDDLKDPQDFCATRPIRPLPFYGAKLAFTWLAIVIPAAVTMTVMGLIAGCGANAFIGGLQVLLWIGFPCTLIAFSCMNYAGGTKSMGMVGSFIIGIVLGSILLFSPGRRAPWFDHMNGGDEVAKAILIILPVLTVAAIWLCLRQARNKHLKHRPIWLTMAGVIFMLCIVFIPLPDPMQPETNQMPAVTQARLNPHFMEVGEKRGTHYIEGQILSPPIEALDARGIHYTYDEIPVNTTGVDAPWFKVYYTGYNEHYNLRSRPMPTELKFRYTVYESEPGRSTNSSSRSSSNSEFYDAVKDLPKRKIRIRDTITIDYQEYEEFRRSSLVEGFSLRTNGMSIRHVPANSDPEIREDLIVSKQFAAGLVESEDIFNRDIFRHYIAHPALDQPIDLSEFGGGGTGTGGLFKYSMTRHHDLSEKGIRSNYKWSNLKEEQAYQGTPAQWKQEAVLITEKAGKTKRAEIPLDFEIEIPDPELLRKMLIENKF